MGQPLKRGGSIRGDRELIHKGRAVGDPDDDPDPGVILADVVDDGVLDHVHPGIEIGVGVARGSAAVVILGEIGLVQGDLHIAHGEGVVRGFRLVGEIGQRCPCCQNRGDTHRQRDGHQFLFHITKPLFL